MIIKKIIFCIYKGKKLKILKINVMYEYKFVGIKIIIAIIYV